MQDFSAATYKNILDYMLSQVPDTYDKRDTSPVQTALGPAAYVLEGFYLSLDQVQKQAFYQTATGAELDLLAPLASLTRRPATAAIRKGEFDHAVPVGTRFSTINGSDSINFIVASVITEGSTYRLQAETVGSIGNTYSGPILPITSVEGLSSARISDILIPGDDTESDEELRKRMDEAFAGRAFGGNVAQYRQEILKLDGVGAVQVYPVWNGGGTVCCSILGADYEPASSELIQTVQDSIDPEPNKGSGLGLAPIGAKVTISTAQPVTLDVTADVVLSAGCALSTATANATSAVSAYLLDIRKHWAENVSPDDIAYSADVYLSRVLAAIVQTDGVVNVSNVCINGSAADVHLTETGALQQVPKMGTVTLHES